MRIRRLIQPAAQNTVSEGTDSRFPHVHRWGGLLKTSRVVFGITLLLLGATSPSGATSGGQVSGAVGEVSGTVKTQSSGYVSMARVTLQSYSGGFPLYTLTDRFGQFSFDQVPIGNYVILVSVPGYVSANRPIVVSAAGPTFGLSIILRPLSTQNPSGKMSLKGSDTVSVRQLRIPKKARQEYNKGLESAARGETDDAIEHWKKSIRIFRSYTESYMQLSKVYANRGNFVDATKAADHAIQLDSKSAIPYESLGYVYLKEKDLPKAKEAFAHAVRLSDSHWLSQFWLGKLLLEQDHAQAAYPHLLRASQLNSENPETDIALYNDLLMLARPKAALARLDDFLKRFPKNPLAAVARAKRRQLKEALDKEEH